MKIYSVYGFFFSSRRRHTSSYGDWSSDVCSSDLGVLEERDERAALSILHELRGMRRLDLQHDIGLTDDRRPITDLHTNGGVGLIRKKRRRSGAALDHDLEAAFDQAARDVRRKRHTPLIGGDFLWHSDAHAV